MPSKMLAPNSIPLSDFPWRAESPLLATETSIPRDIYRVVARHKYVFAATLLLVTAGSVVVAKYLPGQYTSSSTVVIETSQPEAVTLNEMLTDTRADAEAIATELEILYSREFIEQVANRLKLVDNPEFNPALRHGLLDAMPTALFGYRLPASWAAAHPVAPGHRAMNDVVASIKNHLVVGPLGRARAIRIAFTSGDPRTAAAIVNTMADLYMAEHGRIRDEQTRLANSWIDQRLLVLKNKADASSAAVGLYKTEHGLLRSRDSLLVEQEVGEVSTQLTAAQARQTDAAVALADASRGGPQQVSTVLNSPVIQQLRAQEARLTVENAELSSQLGDAHPIEIGIDARIRDIRSQIAAETSRLIHSLQSANQMASASRAATAARMAEARLHVEQADTLQTGLQAKEREAAVDSAFYQTFLTRSKETDPQFNFPRINVRVLSWAVPTDRPSSPNRSLIVLAGLVLGLIMASAAVALREMLAKGLRTPESFERLLGFSPLGIVPYLRRHSEQRQQETLQDAAAVLWARLAGSQDGKLPRSVLVTSAVPREGKTTCSRLLGMAAAERGQRVLIVDADLYRSSLTTAVGQHAGAAGLADIIRGEVTMNDATIKHLPNLDIISAGRADRAPIRLLTQLPFDRFMAQAEAEYDLVILDSPPMLVSSDAGLLASSVEATLLLVRWGHTPASAIKAALRQLSDIRARGLQVVVSQVDLAKHAKYGDATSQAMLRHGRKYHQLLGLAAR